MSVRIQQAVWQRRPCFAGNVDDQHSKRDAGQRGLQQACRHGGEITAFSVFSSDPAAVHFMELEEAFTRDEIGLIRGTAVRLQPEGCPDLLAARSVRYRMQLDPVA